MQPNVFLDLKIYRKNYKKKVILKGVMDIFTLVTLKKISNGNRPLNNV